VIADAPLYVLSRYMGTMRVGRCGSEEIGKAWTESRGQEDVKKLISFSFRDFIFDPKCLPTAQRSLIRDPRAILLTPSPLQILKSIFSHLPDGKFT
jgi:hypothetical protein